MKDNTGPGGEGRGAVPGPVQQSSKERPKTGASPAAGNAGLRSTPRPGPAQNYAGAFWLGVRLACTYVHGATSQHGHPATAPLGSPGLWCIDNNGLEGRPCAKKVPGLQVLRPLGLSVGTVGAQGTSPACLHPGVSPRKMRTAGIRLSEESVPSKEGEGVTSSSASPRIGLAAHGAG